MKSWFYSLNGEQKGPVTLQELQQLAAAGMIDRAKTLVWSEGMADWVPAGSIPEIFQLGLPPASQNPYAAPATVEPAVADPYGTIDTSEIVPGSDPLDVGAIVRRAWDLTFKNVGEIVVLGLIYIAVTGGVSMVSGLLDTVLGLAHKIQYTSHDFEPQGAEIILSQMQNGGVFARILPRLVEVFLSIGITRIGLDIVDGKPVSLALIFSGGSKFLRVLGASILYSLMVGLGLILLIFPGIYLALRYGQYLNLIVDKDCDIMGSFRESARLTEYNKANLFVMALASIAIVIVGILALCLGVFVAIPIIWLMKMIAFRWLQRGRRVTYVIPAA
jgi:uncharacterized membrane protein